MDFQVVDRAPLSELKRICDAMGSQHSAFVSVGHSILFDCITGITGCMLDTGRHGIFVSLNKPHDVIESRLKRDKKDIKNLYFVDCITTMVDVKASQNKKNVVYAIGPHDLDESGSIPDGIKRFVSAISGEKFIIIDALRTLLIYNEPFIVSKFLRELLAYSRPLDVKVIVLSYVGENELKDMVEGAFDAVYFLKDTCGSP